VDTKEEPAAQESEEQEEKLLKILDEPEIIHDEELLKSVDAEIERAFPTADEETKAAMKKVIVAKMPSPEEIEKASKRAQHNRGVELTRQAKLQNRKERRAAIGRFSKKHRRGLGNRVKD